MAEDQKLNQIQDLASLLATDTVYVLRSTTDYEAPISIFDDRYLLESNNLSDLNNTATSRTNLGLGTADTPTFAGLNVIKTSDAIITVVADGQASIQADAYGNQPLVVGRRAEGTQASPTAVTNGNPLLNFGGRGYDGAAFSSSRAKLDFVATQNWTAANQGTRIQFSITANNTTTTTVAMAIFDNGRTALGSNLFSASAKLHVDQHLAAAAIEAALFDQADEDFAILKFIGTSAPGDSDMSLVDAVDFPTLGALIGAIKVRLTDTTGGGIGTNVLGWVPVYAQLT